MKAKIIKDTKIIDYPFLTIMKDTIVEIIGEQTSDGTIVIRYEGHNYLVNACDLEGYKE